MDRDTYNSKKILETVLDVNDICLWKGASQELNDISGGVRDVESFIPHRTTVPNFHKTWEGENELTLKIDGDFDDSERRRFQRPLGFLNSSMIGNILSDDTKEREPELCTVQKPLQLQPL